MQSLIKKVGSYVEILELNIFDNNLRKELFDTVINFCEKIKFLDLCIDHINMSQISKMI